MQLARRELRPYVESTVDDGPTSADIGVAREGPSPGEGPARR